MIIATIQDAILKADSLGQAECSGYDSERWSKVGARLREALELAEDAALTPQDRLRRTLATVSPQLRKELKHNHTSH